MQNANTYLNIRAQGKMKIDRPEYDRRCSDRAALYLNDLFKRKRRYKISTLRLLVFAQSQPPYFPKFARQQ